jgi:hypothetical protein
MRDSERLDPIVDDAVQALRRVLKAGDHDEAEIQQARIASSVLSTWSKLKQTDRAQEGMYLTMARDLAEDRDELARYIELTLPEAPIAGVVGKKKLAAEKK